VLPDFGAFANRELLPTSSDNGTGLSSEKGVSPDLLAALDRLQQEGVSLPFRDTEKSADGSKQIRAQGFRNRDESGVATELEEAAIVGYEHGRLELTRL
jgi:hypothetical protein